MSKHVLGSRVYDTAESELIYEWASPEPRGDLHWVEQALYRTPTGRYFLVGAGGAATAYAKQVGPNNWSAGRGAEILEPEMALEWLQTHGADADDLVERFHLPRA